MSVFPPSASPSAIGVYAAASAFFTAAASATDFGEICGSASKTVEILEVSMGYQSTPSGANFDSVYLIKRSTAGSGGAATTLTNVPIDSSSAAATAVCRNFTANPTVGTAVGNVALQYITANGTAYLPQPFILFKADAVIPPIILRGVAEKLVLNNNGVTFAGSSPLVQVQFKWREIA